MTRTQSPKEQILWNAGSFYTQNYDEKLKTEGILVTKLHDQNGKNFYFFLPSKIKDFKPKFSAIIKRWKLSASLSTAEWWKKFKNPKFTTWPNQSKIERASLKMIPFEELKRRGG